ncbi:MAG: hypothetical protein DRJ69_05750 [Thermoprotei archaeon]|nr:MAG: hypothetical protein DRJ69_05750 [Thermoprotei archaeon]
MRVDKVEAGEVPGVFGVRLLGLEGSTIKRLSVELPKQIQVLKEGEVVEVKTSTRFPSVEEAELCLSGKVFAAREEGGEVTFYLSAGGLQLRLTTEGWILPVRPMDKVYLAFRRRREEG